MATLVPVSGLDDDQRDLFAAWAAVFAASGRHLFGEQHTAFGVDELRELERSPDERRLAVAALTGHGAVVGAAGLAMPLRDNPRLVELALAVLPHRRREGVGTTLLGWGEATAKAHDRSVLVAETQWRPDGTDDAGEGFAAHRGYSPAQTVLRSTLTLPADRVRLEQAAAGHGTSSYDLRTSWDGIPPAWLPGRAELSRRMSTDVPLGDLQLEGQAWDEARIRGEYERIRAMGRRVVDTVALERETGRLVGYTQVQVSPQTPRLGYQQDTLVLREHRGHRLGLRLKAASTLAVMDVLPHVSAIRTWNADDNLPMLAVNGRLGYATDGLLREWQKVLS